METLNYRRDKFFDLYRSEIGRIRNQATVNTIQAILDKGEGDCMQVAQLAYVFATANHEAMAVGSVADFFPVIERGGWEYITRQYWHNVRVRGWLGNRTIQEAWDLRGRGLVQITGYNNYKKFGLLDNPDSALELDVAVSILFRGMNLGMFTGVGLSRYIHAGKTDFVNARRIVNGVDRAHDIAKLANKYLHILTYSQTK